MCWSDDPVRDFMRHDKKKEEWRESRPICDHCKKHIQDEHFYDIGGEYVCPSCLEDHYGRSTDDYMR